LNDIQSYRSYLPDSLNTFLNDTYEESRDVAYDLYDDLREDALKKTNNQVDQLTELMKSFVDKMMSIRGDVESVLDQESALTDEEIQAINEKEGLQKLRQRFDEMGAELQKEVAEDATLPEGVEHIVQNFITTARELLASTTDKEKEFWSKLKQMEVKFWEMKSVVADASKQLKDRISGIFDTMMEVGELSGIPDPSGDEPRSRLPPILPKIES
jgi:ElaB/YqjD/DUF883 family membrane-anchored ribosome-binding protein